MTTMAMKLMTKVMMKMMTTMIRVIKLGFKINERRLSSFLPLDKVSHCCLCANHQDDDHDHDHHIFSHALLDFSTQR